MSGEKTEDPTPERLRKLREKGEAPHSREVTKTAALVAAILAIVATGRASTAALAALAHRCWALETDPGTALVTALELIARAAGAPAGAAAIAAIAAGITQTGALFAPKRIAPDPSRMRPGQVWKGRLRAETLVNAGLALTAAVVTGTASALGVRRLVDVAPAIARAGADGRIGAGLAAVADILVVIVAVWIGAACAAAIVDAVWQRTAFLRQHRMSRQEIVDEYKQLEGDPAHRARRERAHREILATPIREGVARADVLVVNPTHIAVGLRYRPEEAGAPTVTIAGRGVDAKAIRREANRQRVPLIEDRPVARATVDLEIGAEIPDSTYEAVAIVFRWLEQQSVAHEAAR